MDFDSTTHKDYPGYMADKPAKIGPRLDYKPSQGPFDGTTNYSNDFVPRPSEKTENFKPPAIYQPMDAPFDGIPTYKTDYIAKKGDLARSFKPLDGGYKSGAPMDDLTNYKMEYIKRVVSPCPASNLEADSRFTFLEQNTNTGHKWFYEAYKGGKVATQG